MPSGLEFIEDLTVSLAPGQIQSEILLRNVFPYKFIFVDFLFPYRVAL